MQTGNRNYEVQQYYVDGREIYYLVTFCLPRFQDQTLENKLVTVFHELYHISPEFNGDLRRHQGRCAWHTHSKNPMMFRCCIWQGNMLQPLESLICMIF